MERATYATKSFIIALALVLRRLTPERAALAASVEVNSQIERWGEVEDSKYFSAQEELWGMRELTFVLNFSPRRRLPRYSTTLVQCHVASLWYSVKVDTSAWFRVTHWYFWLLPSIFLPHRSS